MSAQTVDDLDHLHRRIQSALAALRGARAVVEHCPSIENQRLVDSASETLDRRLGELAELHKADAVPTE